MEDDSSGVIVASEAFAEGRWLTAPGGITVASERDENRANGTEGRQNGRGDQTSPT